MLFYFITTDLWIAVFYCSAFKINAVCPGYTKTDFTNHNGGDVEEAAKRIIKYALLDKDGPSVKFFSEETNPETGEIPW